MTKTVEDLADAAFKARQRVSELSKLDVPPDVYAEAQHAYMAAQQALDKMLGL